MNIDFSKADRDGREAISEPILDPEHETPATVFQSRFFRPSSGSLGVGRGWLKRSHNVRRDLEGPQTCVMVVDLAIEDDLVRLIAR